MDKVFRRWVFLCLCVVNFLSGYFAQRLVLIQGDLFVCVRECRVPSSRAQQTQVLVFWCAFRSRS